MKPDAFLVTEAVKRRFYALIPDLAPRVDDVRRHVHVAATKENPMPTLITIDLDELRVRLATVNDDRAARSICPLSTNPVLSLVERLGAPADAGETRELVDARDVYAAWCMAYAHTGRCTVLNVLAPPPQPPRDFAFLSPQGQEAWHLLADSINHDDSIDDAIARSVDAMRDVSEKVNEAVGEVVVCTCPPKWLGGGVGFVAATVHQLPCPLAADDDSTPA